MSDPISGEMEREIAELEREFAANPVILTPAQNERHERLAYLKEHLALRRVALLPMTGPKLVK